MDAAERLHPVFSGVLEDTDRRYAAGLAAVAVFALWIRAIPGKGMQYLQALDPYLLARMTEAIWRHGHLPATDVWRYVPFTTPTFTLGLGNLYLPAWIYAVVRPLTGMGFIEYAQLLPAVFGAGMVVVMYFIGKEVFNREVGMASAFFLAASSAVLRRSSAGWFEKEPLGGFFMLTTLYFFVRAWERESWPSGVLAGVSLGAAGLTWGGTAYFYLLIPFATFLVLFLDRDVDRLVAAYTPTIILGHVLPAVLNPGRGTLLGDLALGGMGVLGVLWLRYLVEAYDVVDAEHLGYVVPATTAAGLVAMLLSPLYSQFLARRFFGVIQKATQAGGYGVIGGTVAENLPASANQIVSQLGAGAAVRLLPRSATPLIQLLGGWTFALIGMAGLTAAVALLVARRSGRMERVPEAVYAVIPAILGGAALVAGVLFGSGIAVPIIGAAAISSLGIAVMAWDIDRVPLLSVSAATLGIVAIPVSAQFGSLIAAVFVASVLLLVLAAGGLWFVHGEREVPLPDRWVWVVMFLWVVTGVYGVTERSRLLFLAAQPTALAAGVATGMAARQLRRLDWAALAADTEVDTDRLTVAAVLLVALPVLVVNGAAAYGMAQSLQQSGGSPNQLWMENLNYMRSETPVDAVILSWWDYGYHIEAIGGRAAIADGGNLGFYDEAVEGPKINMPLADFLTASNTSAWMPWLRRMSVDYVVLDSTMIGKYSAVSQIHHRSNQEFNAMRTFGCQRTTQRVRGRQVQRCRVAQGSDGGSYLVYNAGRNRFLVPVDPRANTTPAASPPPTAPILQGGGRTGRVARWCGPDGVTRYDNVSTSAAEGCLAWHPYRQHSQIVFIPGEIMSSTLVELYIMDGARLPQFEKVEEGSNGYVKLWKVDYGGRK